MSLPYKIAFTSIQIENRKRTGQDFKMIAERLQTSFLQCITTDFLQIFGTSIITAIACVVALACPQNLTRFNHRSCSCDTNYKTITCPLRLLPLSVQQYPFLQHHISLLRSSSTRNESAMAISSTAGYVCNHALQSERLAGK